jgi:hypothetical protein
MSIASDEQQILSISDIEIISDPSILNSSASYPHIARFDAHRNWLTLHLSEVDMIFHCDAFDSYFQDDVFRLIDKGSLTFVSEPRLIRDCPFNSAWIGRCFHDGASILGGQILCSGSIGGNSHYYLQFLKEFTQNPLYDQCRSTFYDQAILNYIVWAGVLGKLHIPFVIKHCCDGFATMVYCQDALSRFTKDGRLMSCQGGVVAYVHQYNRIFNIAQIFYRRMNASIDDLYNEKVSKGLTIVD